MNIMVLDLETSKKPILHPWMRGSYLSTIGMKLFLEAEEPIYKDWVWYHDDRPGIGENMRLGMAFEMQEYIDRLGPSGILVGHNIKFDMNWIKSVNVDVSGVRVWCTQVADFMLSGQDKTISQSLSNCCARRSIPIKTDIVKTYWDAGKDTHEIPLKILLPYMHNDIDITAELFKSQWREAKEQPNLMKLIRVRGDSLHVVSDIELNGMVMDRAVAEKHVDTFNAQLETTNAELRTYIGRDDINLGSGQDLSAALYGGVLKRERHIAQLYTRNCTIKEPFLYEYRSGKRKGQIVTRYKNRTVRELVGKKVRQEYGVAITGVGFQPQENSECKPPGCGIFQTNKDVLKILKCGNGGNTTAKFKRHFLDLLVHRSKIAQFTQTFRGTKGDTGLFYQADRNSDGILHPSYNQTVAATGRYSSSNPNGQNFTRSKEDEDGFSNPMKSVFIPSRDGGLILVIDLSQLEWRVAAWLSQDPIAMREIIDGVDCHLDNAIRFFGDAKYRQDAKIFTFRLLYGGSAYAFYMDPKMPDFTKKRWHEICDAYCRKYAVLTAWQENNIRQVAMDKGWLYSPTGRIYRIPKEEHKKYPGTYVYKDTCIKNYPVQGTATGDIVPLAMHVMSKRIQLKPIDYMSTNWMGQVHDSMILDTIHQELLRTAKLGIQVFEDLPEIISKYWGVNFNLPMTGEATCGPNYGDQTWSLKREGGVWIEEGSY